MVNPVIVSGSVNDLRTLGIASAVAARADMELIAGAPVPADEVVRRLDSIPLTLPCALLWVGPRNDGAWARLERWLALRRNLVVLAVDFDVDRDGAPIRFERFSLHDAGIGPMLQALHALMADSGGVERPAQFRLRAVEAGAEPAPVDPVLVAEDGAPLTVPPSRSMTSAALRWLHGLLLAAIGARGAGRVAGDGGDLLGFGVNAASVERAMRAQGAQRGGAADTGSSDSVAFAEALARPDPDGDDPLAIVARRLLLRPREVQFLVLALGPEFDPRYQRCMAVLLDDASRRVGTFGLYCELLGEPVSIAKSLLDTGGLVRWRLMQSGATWPSADEPVRSDPHVAAWLRGDDEALIADPLVRRVLDESAWEGAELFGGSDTFRAASLVSDLRSSRGPGYVVVDAVSAPHALALIEHGASQHAVAPLRVDGRRWSGLDPVDVAETALRLGRAALLTDRPLVVDASALPDDDTNLRGVAQALQASGCRFAVVACGGRAATASLHGVPLRVEVIAYDSRERVDMARMALTRVGAPTDAASVQLVVALLPLSIDNLAAAVRLARAAETDPQPPRERLLAAGKAVAMRTISHLAERVDPTFTLDDIALPQDRIGQLREVVASVRLAPQVLGRWNFQRQMPYGRGTTALFHGPSGTGKTMAAHAIAKELGVQLLRLDLSRVVSKYIGETEKHCDQVFADATSSGAGVLIDEADALFGKRSEVKDAHDRYANIEVAFLLQRIEAFDGLVMLTTNLRQNIDGAFLRRLRFIIEFPRPDVAARAAIWQACLPPDSHTLTAAEVGELARRVDLTGGHIRQITLRAAFLAADRGELIGMGHLVAATRAELAKLGVSAVGLDAIVMVPARRAA